ncbi:MAG: preprotein translocase subunit SecG [Chloroflexota bacterium]
MSTYLYIIQVILSVALIALVVLQSKGAGGLGGLFGGGDSGVYKTRRGVERTLFQVTVGLSVVFVVFSVINVLFA